MNTKINWDDYFLGLAFVISLKSKDPNTKHGCVIVDKNNKIVATGYNGYPTGMNDDELPQTRPDKYKWFIHSEQNAIYNATNLNQDNLKAFITGLPCNNCLIALNQVGIKTIIYADRQGTKLENEETKKDQEKIIKETYMRLICKPINIDWILEGLLNYKID